MPEWQKSGTNTHMQFEYASVCKFQQVLEEYEQIYFSVGQSGIFNPSEILLSDAKVFLFF